MTRSHRQHLLFAAFALGVAALSWQSLYDLFHLALSNPTVSHVMSVPLVTLALVYRDRDEIFARMRPAPWLGGGVVVVALAVYLAGRSTYDDPFHTLTIACLVLSSLGAFLMVYGRASARAALFPLAFLVFVIPLPESLLNGATHVLKTGSAETVTGLFALTGTPFHRDGFVFTLPSVVIEIADECSGIRSTIALVLTGLLGGYQFLRTPWTKTALVFAVLPAAILKNAVRIVTLTLLAVHVDPSFLTGQLHNEGGIVFFLMTLGLLTPFLIFLRWFERSMSRRRSDDSQ